MPRTVRVPPQFEAMFDQAEGYVRALFGEFEMRPEKGTIHVDGERYVLVRGESLFVALYDRLTDSFGREQAHEFLYNMARVIGHADSVAYAADRRVVDPVQRMSAGPVHFAFTGWAFVEIYPDSSPSPDDDFFLHYEHPNTFESEVWQRRGTVATETCCHFSAGYSAGWGSAAYGLELHARELQCIARGDARCEFIMAPFDKLEDHAHALFPDDPNG